MKKTIIITIVVVIIAATGFYLKSRSNNKQEAMKVELTEVKKAEIIQKVNATGKIQPKTQINISADVSAKITSLYVNEGDWVEKGKLLVEIDREKYLASVESQEANVRSAKANSKLVKANLSQAERVLKRSKELFTKKLESQSSLDTADASYQVELARYESSLEQIEQSKGTLKRAKDDLSKTTIYAPMSGTISKLNKEEGEIAIGSQFQEDVIMTIANLNEMEALVNVDENDIIAIKLGQKAEIEVDALLGVQVTGEVSEIATSAIDTQNGVANQKTEFEVKIAVTSNSEKLRPGMTTSANIITETRDNAISVPIQSVTVRTIAQLTEPEEFKNHEYTAGKDGFVEVIFVEKDKKATATQVKTGIQSNDLIEIVEGVTEGESVVSGSYRAISRDLKNGESVQVADKSNKSGNK
ncbi:MAG: efflux RND transporter periplasmic adaptor subunit [Gammaproteobacteria bacterium]|nr:efflux RND transporter periplasmic adaptor subunit [Gammaproteobacteria bacterium]